MVQPVAVTDVASDGMLSGPNLELLGAVCARTTAKVVASGVGFLADGDTVRIVAAENQP